jgi:hypothetical protein
VPASVNSTPAVLDIHLYAGDVGDFQINFKDADGAAVPVNDKVWTAQIRKSRTSIECIDLEIDTANTPFGTITVKIPGNVSRELSQGTWGKTNQWDIQCTNEDGSNPLTVLQGTVYCDMDVTK